MIGHYYMVDKVLWARFGAGKGMLCLWCLEQRVGRPLCKEDFPPAIGVNRDFFARFPDIAQAMTARDKAFA